MSLATHVTTLDTVQKYTYDDLRTCPRCLYNHFETRAKLGMVVYAVRAHSMRNEMLQTWSQNTLRCERRFMTLTRLDVENQE